jgi:hypothetical protein
MQGGLRLRRRVPRQIELQELTIELWTAKLPSEGAGMLTTLGAGDELFHTTTGTAFADLPIDGDRETWPIHSKRFRSLALLPGTPRARRRSTRRLICSRRGHKQLSRIGMAARMFEKSIESD